MKKSTLRIFYYLSVLVVPFCLYLKYPVAISYSNYDAFLEALLTVSSMVFTIMGIWIAFLYPNALSRITDPSTIETADFSTALEDTKRLEGLVGTVIKSAIVVSSIMLIYGFKAIFIGTELYTNFAVQTKGAALAFAIFLANLQLESIGYVIFSNVMFINELHSKRESWEQDQDV